MVRKKCTFLVLLLLIPLSVFAKVEDRILQGSVKITPGESYLLTIDSDSPVKLGLFVDDDSACDNECVSVMQVNDPSAFEYKAQSNAFSDHSPHSGKIEMRYSNISPKPVFISVHQYIYHCDAEACALLRKMGIADPIGFASNHGEYKRLLMASIDSITTAADGSWSDVSGTTLFGEPFDVTIIWWKYDPQSEISCGRGSYIERYKTQLAAGGGPALIDGSLIRRERPIFISVSTCTGRAPSKPKGPDDL